MATTKCSTPGCSKWSFQGGVCKDHYKGPPASPGAPRAASHSIVKSEGKEEVVRSSAPVSATKTQFPITVDTVDGQTSTFIPRPRTASTRDVTKRPTNRSHAIMALLNEDKTLKSQMDADIAARVKKLGKKKLTGGEAPEKKEKSKGILSHFFGMESPRHPGQSPSKEEIRRQNGLRGTSAAAIAEMSQKGVFKSEVAPVSFTSPTPPATPHTPSAPSVPSTPLPSTKTKSTRQNSSNSVEPMFGVDLASVCQNEVLPVPILMIMEMVKGELAMDEGIFRISGSGDDVSLLMANMDACWKTAGPQREALLEGADVHTLAGAFKQFWRKLPEPLFPFAMYAKLVALAEGKDEGVITSLKELPALRQKVAHVLFTYLASVAALAEYNMMSPMNLAICFAPNLIRPRQETIETIVSDTPKIIAVVCLLIQHYLEAPPQ